MTGRPPFLPDPLTRTLDVVTRAARAGQALTLDQINSRLCRGPKVIDKYVRELAEQGLVEIDKSSRPYLVKPVREVRA